MHFSKFFKFALVTFAALPAAYAYGVYDEIEARDIDASEHILAARALDAYYDSSAVTARDLGEAIDMMIVQRQLAGEDTQELEARLLRFIPKIIKTAVKVGSHAGGGGNNNQQQ